MYKGVYKGVIDTRGDTGGIHQCVNTSAQGGKNHSIPEQGGGGYGYRGALCIRIVTRGCFDGYRQTVMEPVQGAQGALCLSVCGIPLCLCA